MKKGMILLAALLLGLLLIVPACAEEGAQEGSEWTVMFYLCGSDLESGHGYASGNIEEIVNCLTYEAVGNYFSGQQEGGSGPDVVNVVLETGGSSQWHAEGLGMDIRTDVLQRWHFQPGTNVLGDRNSVIELAEEVPLASMGEAQTLTDFIRWSVENYPAEKYALVLWDHGTGALNGLIIDELFDGDTLRLDELKAALGDSGVHFEAVLFDACLMANLETAYAIKDSANWMIASEEVVAGKGTAMNYWLQQLIYVPEWDGLRLGRWICEMNMYKYSEQESEHEQNVITWSVINLSKIERVASAFDGFFAACDQIFVDGAHDYDMWTLCEALNDSFEFGLGDAGMVDLANIPYHPYIVLNLDKGLYMELLDALTEAVVYNTHGPERARAGGLSFCYATKLTASQLDDYARVCPSSHYLALLDAINPKWNAPEWVNQQAEKLPEIADLPAYQIRIKKGFSADGTPQITVVDGLRNLRYAYASVLYQNPNTGNIVYLGDTDAIPSEDEASGEITFNMDGFTTEWPTLEGVHCAAQLVNLDYYGGRALYQIPLQMDGETYMLRCGLEVGNPPVVYGLWEGYNADSGVFSRNVMQLSAVAGRDYNLLYPIDGSDAEHMRYETSEPQTMYRSLEISYTSLEPGTYYLDYYVQDIFKRLLPVGRVEVQWDGANVSVDESAWQGEALLIMPKD